MVQNFAVFADRSATAKIKTTKISVGGENDDIIMNEELMYHVAQGRLGRNSAKFCTNKNFQLHASIIVIWPCRYLMPS